MRRRPLGRTGLDVTELGFGGAPLGGLYAAVDDRAARATLEAAWEAGIRYFDTAPLYGFGLSEQRIGAFLRNKPRSSFVLSTKVGRTLRPQRGGGRDRSGSLGSFVGALPNEATFDFSAEAIERSIEQSLERLGLPRIDILYIHDPDDHLEQAIRETYPVLRALRKQGVVRAIGAAMNDASALEAFVRRCDIDVVMLAGRYTVLDRTGVDLLPLCAEHGVAVVAAGVFNSGITSAPSPQRGATFEYTQASGDIVARVRRMASICERYGTQLPTAALRFPLATSAVACAVAGMRSSAEVEANVARLSATIPVGLWAELARETLHEYARPR